MDLQHLRPHGMSPGAIPLGEIRQYCELIGYPEEIYFCRVMMEIDRRVLKELAAQAKLKK